MNILLLASHAVAEFDDLRMLTDLGYDVFSPGGYADPAHPLDDMRPPLPDAPVHRDFAFMCDIQREKHKAEPDTWAIDWGKADLHPDLVDWADAIIVHHFPDRWIGGQWDRLLGKRVIWRTCGQSHPELERYMLPFRRRGLQIVRYSPKEKAAFEALGAFAGEDAMIRFGKYPEDYPSWAGEGGGVGNMTQNMVGRQAYTGMGFYLAATEGLPARPAGERSEELPGGLGRLSYPDALAYWADIRTHLYTGTIPASYTLSLMEAMMTGTPTVSIGPGAVQTSALFEGHELANAAYDDPAHARNALASLLADADLARSFSESIRARALELFHVKHVGAQWKEFLG